MFSHRTARQSPPARLSRNGATGREPPHTDPGMAPSRSRPADMDVFKELMRLTRRLQVRTGESIQPLCWRPAADIYRTRHGWLVKLELAGVPAQEIQVSGHGRELIIRGCRRDMELTEGMEFYSLEIAYSRFERCLSLPFDLEGAQVETEHRHGMLLIHIATEDKQA